MLNWEKIWVDLNFKNKFCYLIQHSLFYLQSHFGLFLSRHNFVGKHKDESILVLARTFYVQHAYNYIIIQQIICFQWK